MLSLMLYIIYCESFPCFYCVFTFVIICRFQLQIGLNGGNLNILIMWNLLFFTDELNLFFSTEGHTCMLLHQLKGLQQNEDDGSWPAEQKSSHLHLFCNILNIYIIYNIY